MSEIQTMMKFELLPNEILIECFEYLNGVDIFHSFDQLNHRLNKLIRSVPLYLDFENIQQKVFNQFCMKLESNPHMKNQIYSLHLSNRSTCYQMQPFLSQFSLGEFLHLRLLTLTKVAYEDIEKLKSMSPLLSQLSCFRLMDHEGKTDHIVATLSMPKLQTLVIAHFPYASKLISDLSSITHLTIDSCYLTQLFKILKNLSVLKYLNVQNVVDTDGDMTEYHHAYFTKFLIHLKQLVLTFFSGHFDDLKVLLKQMPNLKSLTINTDWIEDLFDADQWQNLISSSLLYLNIFKFQFRYSYSKGTSVCEEKVKQFQNDFWQKQHHWYTEYLISNDCAIIYTVPYVLNTYRLRSCTKRYCNELIENVNRFENVIDLIVDPVSLTEGYPFHFSHVSTIRLVDSSTLEDNFLFETKHIESLKMIVNLSNVKHLRIVSSHKFDQSLVLLEMLKEAQQISSLMFYPNYSISLFNNNDLCKYLNQRIKKLDLDDTQQDSFTNSDELKKFCEIFSNIEQLTCTISDKDFLFFLIKHLPKLLYIHVILHLSDYRHDLPLVKEELEKLGAKFSTDYDSTNITALSIWIIRDMYCS